MASGHRIAGIDFDDLFDQDVRGDGPVALGLRRNGVPLRYAALTYGTKRADVGRRENGVDVSNKWAAKGTARYSLPIHGQSYASAYTAKTNEGGQATAYVTISIQSGGGYTVQEGSNVGATTVASGTWNTFAFPVDVRIITAGTDNSDTGWIAVGAGVAAQTRSTVPAASADTQTKSNTHRILFARQGQGDAGIVSDTTVHASTSATGWF